MEKDNEKVDNIVLKAIFQILMILSVLNTIVLNTIIFCPGKNKAISTNISGFELSIAIFAVSFIIYHFIRKKRNDKFILGLCIGTGKITLLAIRVVFLISTIYSLFGFVCGYSIIKSFMDLFLPLLKGMWKLLTFYSIICTCSGISYYMSIKNNKDLV